MQILKFTLVFTHEQSSMCGGSVFVHVRACVKISVCRWLWRVSKISFKITSQGRKLTVGTEIETGFKKGCLKNFFNLFLGEIFKWPTCWRGTQLQSSENKMWILLCFGIEELVSPLYSSVKLYPMSLYIYIPFPPNSFFHLSQYKT